MERARTTGRRRLLTKGAVLLGSAVGVGMLGREAVPRPDTPGALSMTLHGGDWRLTYPDRRRGVPPAPGERSTSYGQLFTSPERDEKAGEFYASSFQFGAPFGPGEFAASAMEMHHFNLPDGTIVGMGTIGGFHENESVHAIIGGTGRYTGATGSYVARQSPLDLGGDGTAQFTFNITLGSA